MKTYIQLLISIFIIFSQILSCRTDKKPDRDFKQITSVSGDLDFLEDGDSVRIGLSEFIDVDSIYTTVVKDGKFAFEWNQITRPLTMRIYLPMRKIPNKKEAGYLQTTWFTMIPGNKVQLSYKDDEFMFKGIDAAVFNCQYLLYKEKEGISKSGPKFDVGKLADLKASYKFFDSLNVSLLEKLNQWKGQLPKKTFDIIRLDLIYGNELMKYYFLNIQPRKAKIIDYTFKDVTGGLIDSSLYSELRNFPDYFIQKFKFDSYTSVGKRFQLGDGYRFIDKMLSGKLREKCLTRLIIKNLQSDSLKIYRNMALNTIENAYYKKLIKQKTKKHIGGGKAPDFSVSDKEGKMYSLSDFKGKVVVLDFWFTGCGPCKQVAPYLGRIADRFKSAPVVFLSICVDRSKETWLRSVSEGEYTFNNSIKVFTGGKEHSIIKDYGVRGYPTIILISPEGKLMRSGIDPRLDNGKDLEFLIREKI